MGCYGSYRKKKIRKDPLVNVNYEALESDYDVIQALIAARKNLNMTQKELSKRTGITQADISRIERGTRNPSIEMVKRLAREMGMVLKLEFIPEDKSN